MKNKRPRILRNRRPKQIDIRPLMEVSSAAHTAAQLMRELAAASQGVDAFLREKFFVGIATGPSELVMSAEAVMRIPAAVRWADNSVIDGGYPFPVLSGFVNPLETEINGDVLSGYWVDENGGVQPPPG
jgi:hypothetical protein